MSYPVFHRDVCQPYDCDMKSMVYYNISATQQSGTKPNLVAKILATKFGFVPDCSVH